MILTGRHSAAGASHGVYRPAASGKLRREKECERPEGVCSSFAEREGPGSELLLRMCGSQRCGIKRRRAPRRRRRSC